MLAIDDQVRDRILWSRCMTLHRDIRRQTKLHRTKIGPATLHLDEIRDIADALQQFSAAAIEQGKHVHEPSPAESTIGEIPDSPADANRQLAEEVEFSLVEIAADDAVADRVDDLRHATAKEIKRVSVSTKDERVRIDLWDMQADIAVKSGDAEARAIAEDIKEFVKKRRSYRASMAAMPKGVHALLLGMALLYSSDAIIALFRSESTRTTRSSSMWGSLFWIALWLLSPLGLSRALGAIQIVPEWRANARGLSRTARRDLLIVLAGALVGGIVAGVLGFWNSIFAK